MPLSAKREYVIYMRTLYQVARTWKEKMRIVKQVYETLSYHRKHAISLMCKDKPPSGNR